MKKVMVTVLITSILFAGLLIGCSKAESPSEAASTGKEVAKAAEPLKIGVSIDKLFEGRQAELDGVRAQAEKLGIVLVEVVADGDPQKQNSQIQSLIVQDIDALLVVAVDQTAIEVALKAVDAAGIPIVAFDRLLPDSAFVSSFSGLDSYSDGLSAGTYLMEQYQDKGEKITILELLGALNDQNAIDRSKGFNDALKGYENIEIVQMPTDWDANKALTSTENALQANPDIWAIYIPSDFMVASVETVLKDLGKLKKAGTDGHVHIVGVDGNPAGYESVKNGYSDATVVLNLYEVGATAVKAAVSLINGESVKEINAVPGVLYTYENIEANKDKVWGAK